MSKIICSPRLRTVIRAEMQRWRDASPEDRARRDMAIQVAIHAVNRLAEERRRLRSIDPALYRQPIDC